MTLPLIKIVERDGERVDLSGMKEFAARLEMEDIVHLLVATEAVAGAKRKGKSTVQNIQDRYLNKAESSATFPPVESYLFEPEGIERKFATSHARQPCTQGISVLRDPHIVERNGKKLAVFQIDPQGLFEAGTTKLDYFLFFICSLISSILVLNVMNSVDNTELKMLAEISHLAQQIRASIQTGQGAIFQELIILVRDALPPADDSAAFGWEAGQIYLDEECLSGPGPEVKTIKAEITKAYKRVSCFAMPKIADHPEVKNFRLLPEVVRPEFYEWIGVYLDQLFGSQMLRPFQHSGRSFTCGELAKYLKHILVLFESDQIPVIGDMLSTMVRLELQQAIEGAFEAYRLTMETMTCSAVFAPERLQELHESQKNIVVKSICDTLERNSVIGKSFGDNLENLMENEFQLIMKRNTAKRQTEEQNYRKLCQAKKDAQEQMHRAELEHMQQLEKQKKQAKEQQEKTKREAEERIAKAEKEAEDLKENAERERQMELYRAESKRANKLEHAENEVNRLQNEIDHWYTVRRDRKMACIPNAGTFLCALAMVDSKAPEKHALAEAHDKIRQLERQLVQARQTHTLLLQMECRAL